MDGIFTIILRTIFLYFLLWFAFRVIGKKLLGQLSILDLIISFMIAEMAVMSIEDPNTPMLRSIVSIGVLVMLQIFIAAVRKNEKARHHTGGKPKEKINQDEKRFDDFLFQLQETNNVKNVSDVEFAILEPSGKLSVCKRFEESGGETAPEENIAQPLILDGKIQEQQLNQINKSEFWLRRQLRQLGLKDIKKISYCEWQPEGTFFVDFKDES